MYTSFYIEIRFSSFIYVDCRASYIQYIHVEILSSVYKQELATATYPAAAAAAAAAIHYCIIIVVAKMRCNHTEMPQSPTCRFARVP